MSRVFGSPAAVGRPLDRGLRRWRSGLVAGRSEAAAPVRLSGVRRAERNRDGPEGAPGPTGAPGDEDPLTRGHHAWYAAPRGNGTGSSEGTQFGIVNSVFGSDFPLGWPGPDSGGDLATIPYDSWSSVNFADRDASQGVAKPLVQMGLGNGRGGFLMSVQFGFLSPIPPTKSWFAGPSESLFGTGTGSDGTLNTQRNLVGVGALAGETHPSFVYNDGAGNITKVSTGLADINTATVYEVRVFADPRTTTAHIRFEVFSHGRSVNVADHIATSNLPVSLMWPVLVNIRNGATTTESSLVFRSMFVSIQPMGVTIDS